MNDAIIAALITGFVSLFGSILASLFISHRTETKIGSSLEASQKATNTKLEDLTLEVRMHNNYGKRIPEVEQKIKSIDQRVIDLEKGAKNED